MNKMSAILCLLIVTLMMSYANCSDDASESLVVVNTPSYYKYSMTSDLPSHELNDFLLAQGGFTVARGIEWTGLSSSNSAKSPQVTVVFVANTDLNTSSLGSRIPIDQDATIDLGGLASYITTPNTLKYISGVPSSDDQASILSDCSNQNGKTVYLIDAEGVALSDIKSVNQAIASCGDNLASFVLQTNNQMSRHSISKRQATEEAAAGATIKNQAVFYSDTYPIMFHLFFWVTLLLALALFGISYGMWNMDPGLDTVIYRMTSQRIKKDN